MVVTEPIIIISFWIMMSVSKHNLRSTGRVCPGRAFGDWQDAQFDFTWKRVVDLFHEALLQHLNQEIKMKLRRYLCENWCFSLRTLRGKKTCLSDKNCALETQKVWKLEIVKQNKTSKLFRGCLSSHLLRTCLKTIHQKNQIHWTSSFFPLGVWTLVWEGAFVR